MRGHVNLIAAALMAPTSTSGGAGMGFLLVQVGLIFAVFYFLILRPQSVARKKHAELLAALKKGDEVVTAGGLMGRVKEIKDEKVTIETGTAAVVVHRQRIVQVGGTAAPGAN
jgi:preprotein translocase subunit YajC